MLQNLTLKTDYRSSALIVVILALLASFIWSYQVSAQATPDIQKSTCQGAELQFTDTTTPAGDCTFAGQNPQGKLNELIAQVINIFSVIVGVVAVIMIIVGGFRYITSGGDSGNVTAAKNTILYAIVGLIIVALAQFIVKFVLSKATA